mmetsp:Transcript_17562/g.48468  ORF Transcript_17562/g.48468 Transcript_17562/m.48468 type:complete len:488 (+) Transcript_17562:1130-2593(+)
MEVQEDAHRVLLAPIEQPLQVLQLPGHEGRHGEDHPVAEWHPDSIDSMACHPSDVLFCDPVCPVFLHSCPGHAGVECRHKAVLVLGCALVRKFLPGLIQEQISCHPLLEQEPIAEIHPADERPEALAAACEENLPLDLVFGLEHRLLARLPVSLGREVEARARRPQGHGAQVPLWQTRNVPEALPVHGHVPRCGGGAAHPGVALVGHEVTTCALAEQCKHRRVQVLAVYHERRRRIPVLRHHGCRHQLGVRHEPEERSAAGVCRVLVTDQTLASVCAKLVDAAALQPHKAASGVQEREGLPLPDELGVARHPLWPVRAEHAVTGAYPDCDLGPCLGHFKPSCPRWAVLATHDLARRVRRGRCAEPPAGALLESEGLAPECEGRVVREAKPHVLPALQLHLIAIVQTRVETRVVEATARRPRHCPVVHEDADLRQGVLLRKHGLRVHVAALPRLRRDVQQLPLDARTPGEQQGRDDQAHRSLRPNISH